LASGLEELVPPRPVLFDAQLDLQSVALDPEPAQATASPIRRKEPAAVPEAGENSGGGARAIMREPSLDANSTRDSGDA
jgi:hypothetical protein